MDQSDWFGGGTVIYFLNAGPRPLQLRRMGSETPCISRSKATIDNTISSIALEIGQEKPPRNLLVEDFLDGDGDDDVLPTGLDTRELDMALEEDFFGSEDEDGGEGVSDVCNFSVYIEINQDDLEAMYYGFSRKGSNNQEV